MASQIENFKDSSLKTLMTKIKNDLVEGGINFDNFYITSQFADLYEYIEDSLTDLGMPAFEIDIEYIIQCFALNPDFENPDKPIVKPELSTFVVNHTFIEDIRVEKNLSQTINSYFDLDEDILTQMEEIGVYDITEGKVTNKEETYNEFVDQYLESIYKK